MPLLVLKKSSQICTLLLFLSSIFLLIFTDLLVLKNPLRVLRIIFFVSVSLVILFSFFLLERRDFEPL